MKQIDDGSLVGKSPHGFFIFKNEDPFYLNSYDQVGNYMGICMTNTFGTKRIEEIKQLYKNVYAVIIEGRKELKLIDFKSENLKLKSFLLFASCLNFLITDNSDHNCILKNTGKCAYCLIGFDLNEKDPKKLKNYLLEATDKIEGDKPF